MDLFTEGQKITLSFQKASSYVEMTCSIEKIWDDRLDLVLPQYFMRYIEFLQVGQKLTAKAFTKLGTIDFNTIIIASPLEETFTIELDSNSLKLTQGSDLPVVRAVEKLSVKNAESIYDLNSFELSTEYIKFNSDIKFELGTIIDCTLSLPKDYGTIDFKSEVTEIDPIYDNEYTATYITMTEDCRQTLLYYIYMYTKDSD